MSPHDRQARADRAKAALAEFLNPAFDHVEREWYEKMVATAGSSDPRLPDVVLRLAAGVQAIRKVRAEILAVIADGNAAEVEIAREAQLNKMSTHMRSVVGG